MRSILFQIPLVLGACQQQPEPPCEVWPDDVDGLKDFCEVHACPVVAGDLVVEGTRLHHLDGLSCITEIRGDVRIGDPDRSDWTSGGYTNFSPTGNPELRSLTGLRNLTAIGGDLVINQNGVLETLDGLQALQSVGHVDIFDNHRLEELADFQELSRVDSLVVSRNTVLQTLSGLEGIVEVGGHVDISTNPQLTSLSGLDGVVDVGSLTIDSNFGLTSLVGLGQVRRIDSDLTIDNNISLVDVSSLHGLEHVGDQVSITNNRELTDVAAQALVDEIDFVGGRVSIENNDL